MQHDDTAGARLAAPRVLSAEVLASLRAAYAEEVAERLPRLRAAAATGVPGPDAVRDAHSLGSSSFVVGEARAGDLAREVEALLLAGEPFADAVGRLADSLRAWSA